MILGGAKQSGSLDLLRRYSRGLALGRLWPVALAFEWVGGQLRFVAALVGVEVSPIDCDAAYPQSAESLEAAPKFLRARHWQRGEHNLIGRLCRMLTRKRGERLPRTNFEQQVSWIFHDFGDTV